MFERERFDPDELRALAAPFAVEAFDARFRDAYERAHAAWRAKAAIPARAADAGARGIAGREGAAGTGPGSPATAPGIAGRALENSAFGVLGFAWPLAIALFTTPFIVHKLGADLYGALSIVGVTLGFFGFLDFGIGGAATRQIATYHERDAPHDIGRVVSTVLAFYLAVGAVVGVLMVLLTNTMVTQLLGVPAALQQVVRVAFYVAAPSFASSLVIGAFMSVPSALQRFDISTGVQLALTTVNAAMTVVLLWLGHGIVAIMLAGLVVNAAMLPVGYALARRLVPEIVLRPVWDVGLMRELFRFGGYFLLSSIGVLLLYQLDKLLISHFLGVGAITYYVLPGSLAQKLQGIVAAAAAVVFPMSAAFFAGEQRDTLLRLYREGSRMVFIAISMLAVPMAVFADKFLRFWVGSDIAAHSAVPMVLLVATYALLAATAMSWGIANGSGRARINAFFTLAIAAVDIALFLVLIRPFGVTGAAAAYLVSAAIGAPALIAYTERRLLHLSGVEFLKVYWRVGVVTVIQCAIAYAARALAVSLLTTVALMVFSAASFVLIYVLLGFVQAGDRRVVSLLTHRFTEAE